MRQLAKQAAKESFDLIISVGGDGTCHEVLNGLIEEDQLIAPKTQLAVVPIGTGSDLIKFNTPKGTASFALQIAAFGETRLWMLARHCQYQ